MPSSRSGSIRGWWLAVKVGGVMAYWYPFGRAWGYQSYVEQYYGVMVGKGHPPV